jgi:hypothetical protein
MTAKEDGSNTLYDKAGKYVQEAGSPTCPF